MPKFRVAFLKRVYDHRGFEHLTCQARFELNAKDSEAAVESAERLFCRERQIPKWNFHADEFRVAPIVLRNAGQVRHGAVIPPEANRVLRQCSTQKATGRDIS